MAMRSAIGPSLRASALSAALSCGQPVGVAEAELGRPIALASGDDSPIPRLAFIDEGCLGSDAVGGCPDTSARNCVPVLIDSFSPLSAIRDRRVNGDLTFGRECLDVRSAAGMAAKVIASDVRASAVTRLRLRDVPLVRAPAAGTDRWQWSAGNEASTLEPGAVLGGNVLRNHAVMFRHHRSGTEPPTVTFFGEFPGTSQDLADAGFATIPVQFPGRLLGPTVRDRCKIGDTNCVNGGFEIQGSETSAYPPTRMVVDACVGVPPCTVTYAVDETQIFSVGECRRRAGSSTESECISANDPTRGGKPATLVVATGVPGLVLFSDSARRMFGSLDDLPACARINIGDLACRIAQDGRLRVTGWPAAGTEQQPLLRLRVRSLALVPGLTRPRGLGPCDRVARRSAGLVGQCAAFSEAFAQARDIDRTTPPYASTGSKDAMVVVGEAQWPRGAEGPDAARWLEVHVVPDDHPLPLALRRDVAPEALQPDGLLGTALLHDTTTVLDYTDANPGLRVACLDPRSGDCAAAPECRDDTQSACCFGLPIALLSEFILRRRNDTCCPALSASELAEVQSRGACLDTTPP